MDFMERDGIDYTVEGCTLYEIVNLNEKTVLAAMRQVYAEDRSHCRCSLCVEDVYALALNSLPPRYIQPTSLDLYERGRHAIPPEEVRAKVLQAAEKVRSGPKHVPGAGPGQDGGRSAE